MEKELGEGSGVLYCDETQKRSTTASSKGHEALDPSMTLTDSRLFRATFSSAVGIHVFVDRRRDCVRKSGRSNKLRSILCYPALLPDLLGVPCKF